MPLSTRILLLPLSLALVSCTPSQTKTQSSTGQQPVTAQMAAADTPEQGKSAAKEAEQPFTAPIKPRPYPLSKAGFDYGPGRDWPLQEFDPTRPGPLVSVTEPVSPWRDGICATAQAAVPMDAGPRQNWAAKKATALISGMLGGFLGGGGGGGSEPARPGTVDNPLEKLPRQQFSAMADEMDLELAGQLTEQGLLINTHIDDAPGKPTFHTIYIERRDCQRAWPNRYLVYELWLEWSLSVSWTRTETQYRNGDQVSQRKTSGGFNKAGDLLLDKGAIGLNRPGNLDDYQQGVLANAPPPIWQSLGFNGPEAGIRELGSQFNNVNAQHLAEETVAIVHIARPAGERYTTEAIAFRLQPQSNGAVKFIRL